MTIKPLYSKAILSVLITVCFDAFSQPCIQNSNAFDDGEELVYKVSYALAGAYVGAGEATFTTTKKKADAKTIYHIQGEGHTYPSYDWFFKVRDLYQTFLDSATLLPQKFIRNVDEGGYKIYNHVLFNHAYAKAVSTNGVFKITACTQDVLSAIYCARNIDFSLYKIGDKIPVSLFLDDSLYNIYIRYLGKERIKTKSGIYQTIKFKPLLINGTIFKGGEKMEVWVSDDANRVPILVKTPIIVGDIVVHLIRAKNIKHNSMIPYPK